jgi:hypothetical protein
MKYLKTWMGRTSGSHLGRGDGYPEQKSQIIESLDDLVRTYSEDAEYYKLEPVDVKGAVSAVKDLAL